MTDTIHCEELRLRFGKKVAIRDLTTTLSGRKIVGLLGRNGCGKTSLLHTFLGLIRPTEGTCEVFGKPAEKLDREDFAKIGFVHQEGGYIDSMTVQTHLNYIASFYPEWDRDREARLLGAFELDPRARVGRLSTGDKQKLGIILAVSHRPALLLLDEPASALDPVVRREMFHLLFEMVEEDGASVVVSSHILMDVEKVIDHVWFMRAGRLVVDEPLDALLESYAEWDVVGDLPGEIDEPYVVGQSGEDGTRTLIVRAGEIARREFAEKTGAAVTSRPLNLERLFPLLAKGDGKGQR